MTYFSKPYGFKLFEVPKSFLRSNGLDDQCQLSPYSR